MTTMLVLNAIMGCSALIALWNVATLPADPGNGDDIGRDDGSFAWLNRSSKWKTAVKTRASKLERMSHASGILFLSKSATLVLYTLSPDIRAGASAMLFALLK